jgi:type II secretory pathway pseudopilin PulG
MMNTLGAPELFIILLVFAATLLIPLLVCFLLYNAFRRIPVESRQMDPALVWLLMIPCFSLVWNFFVFTRLPRSLKSHFDSAGRRDVDDCGWSLGLGYSICAAISIIPYLGCLTAIAALVLLVLFLAKVNNLSGQILKDTGAFPLPSPAVEAPTRSVQPSRTSPALIAVLIAVAALGVLSAVGIIAAIAIPNFLNAMERAKVRRTMADMRTLSVAVESYAADRSFYPAVHDMKGLADVLEPKYIREMPRRDAWIHEFVYRRSEGPEKGFEILSYGKDGLPGPPQAASPAEDFNADIVISNGQFSRSPAGGAPPTLPAPIPLK